MLIKQIASLLLVTAITMSANTIDNTVYVTNQIKAEGESAPNQTRYSATRAAQMDAQRRLLEIVGGLKLTSSTTVKDGILQSDTIASHLQGRLRGAVVLEKYYDKDEGYATVVMGIGSQQSLASTLALSKEEGTLEKTLYKDKKPSYYKTETLEKEQRTKITQTTTASHDSIIIDVRGLDFEPAQINRIYFDEQLIYDPLMVPAVIISQRGLAKYTTSLNKAKAILESFNASQPIVAKATSLTSLASDVKISQADATRITNANTDMGFLEAAKVVFIVE